MLLPCPFCDSLNLISDGDITQSQTIEWETCYITCEDCKAEGPYIERNSRDDGCYDVLKEATDAWNRRNSTSL